LPSYEQKCVKIKEKSEGRNKMGKNGKKWSKMACKVPKLAFFNFTR
jgi:hypothetical protein